MRLVLTQQPASCPYRLLDEENHEVTWVNDFLDAQHLRQLSPRSLRAYAYDLLHFARWFQGQPQILSEITESTLLNYVRHQLNQLPQPIPQTGNHRLTVIGCLYRFHLGQDIPSGQSHFQRTYATRCPVGYGRPHRNVAFGLRLKQPRRVIQPLSAEQVSRFWASFRTFRDLAVVGLMLLDGLRSCEILSLQTGGFEIGRCPATRSGQRQETAHGTAARRNHGGAAKLSSSGTAPDQLAVSVHLAKRPTTRAADDAGWTLFPISPSSIAQHGGSRQSAPISPLCTIPDYASLSNVKWLCALVGATLRTLAGATR